MIRGFRAELDLDLLGLPFEALVFVTMRAGDYAAVSAFEAAVAEVPDVVQAHRLFGDPDYQLYDATDAVYGYDINPDYLAACEARYRDTFGARLHLIETNIDRSLAIESVDLLIANLIIE